MDANVPAGLLKLWIRELPEPLIVEDTYELALEAGRKIRKGKEHTHTRRAGGRAEGRKGGRAAARAERACADRQPLAADSASPRRSRVSLAMRQQLELPQPWPLAIVYDCDRPLWAGAPDAAEAVEQVCCAVTLALCPALQLHGRVMRMPLPPVMVRVVYNCGMFAWHLSWCIPRCISVVRNDALCMPQCHLRVRYVCCVSGRELCAAVSCCTSQPSV